MEEKNAEGPGNKLLSDTQPTLEDKSVGKISTSTTTTSLYTEDEQDPPEVVPERKILEKPKNVIMINTIFINVWLIKFNFRCLREQLNYEAG